MLSASTAFPRRLVPERLSHSFVANLVASAPTTKHIPHVDHVGSLLRPKELVEKRIAYHMGKCSPDELKVLEDETVPKMVRLQKELGLTVLTDGEVRR